MSKRRVIKAFLIFTLSIIFAILLEIFSSKIIHYEDWTRFVTGAVYFYMFFAILADTNHVMTKEESKYSKYHVTSIKWEIGFVISFFTLTVIINDVALKKYDNIWSYSIIFMLSFLYMVYNIKKLKTTVQ